MKKEFVNPIMEIKSFNKENLITMSGEAGTNEQAVTTALDTTLSSTAEGAEVKKSSYILTW